MSTSAWTAVATATFRVKLRKAKPGKQSRPQAKPTARVLRVARLVALAHKIDGMIRCGELKNWAEAAGLIGVTRARMTQISNLMLLAPETQLSLLVPQALDMTTLALSERSLRSLLRNADWVQQKKMLHPSHPLPADHTNRKEQ